MPPKKDGDAPKDDKKKAQKRNKPRKKKDECPSRIRKTNRVVLNKQARDIIAKVYDFMKREALAEYAEKLSNARWRTATAVGVSEKTVSRILKDRNKKLAGSAVVGTEALIRGKAEAAKNYGQAIGSFLTGNITGAEHSLVNAVGDCVGADVAGATIAAAGVANASRQIIGSKIHADGRLLAAGAHAAGEILGGKLAALSNVASGISALASSNITAAESSFTNAAASLVAADADAIGTLLSSL